MTNRTTGCWGGRWGEALGKIRVNRRIRDTTNRRMVRIALLASPDDAGEADDVNTVDGILDGVKIGRDHPRCSRGRSFASQDANGRVAGPSGWVCT